MLTDVDIHFLTGLLMTVHSPDSVEVRLGETVFDEATGTRRDVDITVRRNNNGGSAAFAGIEVKKHGRKLDATHVEQLACKLNDMPDLSNRSIVSASGFTGPAIAKAAHHEIDLYTIEPLNQEADLNGMMIPPEFFFTSNEENWEWVSFESRLFRPATDIPSHLRDCLSGELEIIDARENSRARGLTLRKYFERIVQRGPKALLRDQANNWSDGEHRVNFHIGLDDRPVILIGGERVELTGLEINAVIRLRTVSQKSDLRVLRSVKDEVAYGCCAVAEQSNKSLMCMMFGRRDRSVRLAVIPATDRELTQIRSRKLL